ncbi:MAG TPA: hypothetical protein EYP08_02850 [Pyrodictiaceae archaeon]|nr:hypothetical protein [Pyrodictiaceae archaeon]
MAAVEYSELPILLAYIACIKWILIGLLSVLFGDPFGLVVSTAVGIIFGIVEYAAAFIVLNYILHKM